MTYPLDPVHVAPSGGAAFFPTPPAHRVIPILALAERDMPVPAIPPTRDDRISIVERACKSGHACIGCDLREVSGDGWNEPREAFCAWEADKHSLAECEGSESALEDWEIDQWEAIEANVCAIGELQ